jgi:spore coat polysaccharide biosynthesis protein SpsF
MAKVVACIIARTVSKRLPLKVLRDIYPSISMIEFLIARVKSVQEVSEIYICTSTEQVDDILEDVAYSNQVKIYRGSAEQVIERMLAVGNLEQADILIRITGDNPFTAIEYIPQQLSLLLEKKLDYVRVIDVPIGATAELMTYSALFRCNDRMDPNMSEYLMLYMFDPSNFRCGVVKPFREDFGNYSVTVDTYTDFERAKGILKYSKWKPGDSLMQKQILALFQDDSKDLPGKQIKSEGDIKLPYGKTVTFAAFKSDIDSRIRQSELVQLYE